MRRTGTVLASVVFAACSASAGRFELRYPTGERRSSIETRNGVHHGEAITWHRNGQVESSGTYRDGKRHGTFEYHSPAGAVVNMVVYYEDREVWSSRDATANVPDSVEQMFADAEQQAAEAVEERSTLIPAFTTTDPLLGQTGADVRIDTLFPPEFEGESLEARRLGFTGQWYPGQVGAYGRLTSTSRGGLSSDFRHGKTVGEAGAVLNPARTPELLVRVGLYVPISGDDIEGLATERATSFDLVRDSVYHLPRSMGARMSVGILLQRRNLYGRGDVGLDHARSIAGDGVPRMEKPSTIFRADAAVGLIVGAVVLAGELAWARSPDDSLESPATVGFSLHLPRARFQPYGSFVLPVRGWAAGNGATFTVGLSYQQKPAPIAAPSEAGTDE